MHARTLTVVAVLGSGVLSACGSSSPSAPSNLPAAPVVAPAASISAQGAGTLILHPSLNPA